MSTAFFIAVQNYIFYTRLSKYRYFFCEFCWIKLISLLKTVVFYDTMKLRDDHTDSLRVVAAASVDALVITLRKGKA